MTEKEYKDELQKLEEIHERNKRQLYKDYAMANNTYELGDVIKDYNGFGEIVKIKFSGPMIGNLPQCVYVCKELTVKKQYKKGEPLRDIWQSNIKQP